MSAELEQLFVKIGLSDKKAKETAANKKLSGCLEIVIKASGATDSTFGALLYTLASTITKDAIPHLDYLSKAIASKRLKTNDQISAAIKFAEGAKDKIDDSKFDEACGV
ncbi:hypothetical protein HDV05_008195, partial [Chytridiales sp. JEL 0842]